MSMVFKMSNRRKIIKIDEEKCDGCGLCVPACPEGALQIVAGKARVVKESYCDGLGVCIGKCPKDAITIEEREAEEFDPEAVAAHMKSRRSEGAETDAPEAAHSLSFAGCPGAASGLLRPAGAAELETTGSRAKAPESRLVNWPVQLRLVPLVAPYFQNANLLISADCIPFYYADFHRRLLDGRTLLVGCPKLDDVDLYRRKLAALFAQNEIKSIAVVHMEVPCCFGLVQLVRAALEESGKRIPLTVTKVSIRDGRLETVALQAEGNEAQP